MEAKKPILLQDLKNYQPAHDFFIGLDSDGCVFDTMATKQREHFHPLIIKYWHLEKCADALCACADFSNLISRYRGSNRFPALLRTLQWFNAYPGVAESGIELPKLDALRAYVNSGLTLGNPTLEEEVERTRDPELVRLLEWSLEVNKSIAERMRPVPPFPEFLAALKAMRESCDLMVVSQTPEAALRKEWGLHGIADSVSLIPGQEAGTKSDQLHVVAVGKYPTDHVLMIGDAQGDLAAAQKAGTHFYPIIAQKENGSWASFRTEAYPRFLQGTYAGEYEQKLIDSFVGCLPETPSWEKPSC